MTSFSSIFINYLKHNSYLFFSNDQFILNNVIIRLSNLNYIQNAMNSSGDNYESEKRFLLFGNENQSMKRN